MGFFKKNKTMGDGTCLFINEVGAISTRVFKIIPTPNAEEVILDFGNNERYTVPTKNLRAKRCVLYKLPNGKIISYNPDKWGEIDLKAQGIKELRFNLQNFSIQEGTSALHRWTLPQTTMDKLLPLFKVLFICIAVAVVGWSAFKFSTYVLDIIVKSRILPCETVFPNIPIPIGAINSTMPLGA